jgi:hypothetical protein
VEIVAALSSLRCLSDVFKEGDQLRLSLGQTIDTIAGTIRDAQGDLYDITLKDSRRQFYTNGISYKDVKKMKIIKDMLFSLFRDPSNGMTPLVSKPHISIDWCIEPRIEENWMDRWDMVFDEDPHGNRDIPLYFVRKLYVEFILGKHVSYFEILEFQGIGRGMTQNREHARANPNHVHPPPHPRNHSPHLYPSSTSVFDQTQDALLQIS